jgi:cell division protein ZapB
VNHIASTNGIIVERIDFQEPYNRDQMSDAQPIDQIAERVERLLLRHEELQRTNALLQKQVHDLEVERDLLKSRLNAARARIDALLERLPLLSDGTQPKDIQ